MTPRLRFDEVDFLRGLAMVLMALDHVRDFFSGSRFDPLDLTRTTPAWFFTRWITHFCAPTFIMLAGVGAYLYGWRGRTPAERARFLLTRGLWLVVLELTVIRFAWLFNVDYSLIVGQVIWAIGWAMVALAGLVWLPAWAVGTVGALIIGLHNLLDPITPAQLGAVGGGLWVLLHEGGFLPYGQGGGLLIFYPMLPWVGVMAAGYGLGPWLVLPPATRNRRLRALGLGLIGAFVGLSLLHMYGDPTPWTTQRTPFRTVLSALDTEKYPPALLYVLMTLGPALVLLSYLDRVLTGAIRQFFVTFGRVPLFYYVLHLLLIHSLALLTAQGMGLDTAFLFHNGAPGADGPPAWGFGLPVVYAVWIGVVLALYPLCRWFAGVKARGQWWGWSYL